MRRRRIELSRADLQRLRTILDPRRASHQEIDEARIVDADDMAADVVTMQSEVRVRDGATGCVA